jgi:hypothetical protein
MEPEATQDGGDASAQIVKLAENVVSGKELIQVTLSSALAAVDTVPTINSIEELLPKFADKFDSVLGYGTLPQTGFVYQHNGLIERGRLTQSRRAREIERARLASAVINRYCHLYRFPREVYMDRALRTADSALSIKLYQLFESCTNRDQQVKLSRMLRETADIPFEQLYAGLNRKLWVHAVVVGTEQEIAIAKKFQEWLLSLYYSDVRDMLDWAHDMSGLSIQLIPPSIADSSYYKSIRPWSSRYFRNIVDNNIALQPIVADHVHAQVSRRIPSFTMGVANAETTLSVVKLDVTKVDDFATLFSGDGQVSPQKASDTAALWVAVSCSNASLGARVMLPAAYTANLAMLMRVLAWFFLPTFIMTEASWNMLRNYVVLSILAQPPLLDSQAARTGEINYSLRGNFAKVPLALEDFLNTTWGTETVPRLPGLQRYGWDDSQIAYRQVFGTYLIDEHVQHPLWSKFQNVISIFDAGSAPKGINFTIEQRERRRLVAALNSLPIVNLMRNAYLLQESLSVLSPPAGAMMQVAEAYAPDARSMRIYALPLAGALSLCYCSLPMSSEPIYDKTFQVFAERQVLARSAALLCDAREWAFTRFKDGFTRGDRYKMMTLFYDSFGVRNWFIDAILKGLEEVPLRLEFVTTAFPNVWLDTFATAEHFVDANMRMFGYSDTLYISEGRYGPSGNNFSISYMTQDTTTEREVTQGGFLDACLGSEMERIAYMLPGADGCRMSGQWPVEEMVQPRRDGVLNQHSDEILKADLGQEWPVSYDGVLKVSYVLREDMSVAEIPKTIVRPPTLTAKPTGQLALDTDMVDALCGSSVGSIPSMKDACMILTPTSFRLITKNGSLAVGK